MAREKDLDSNIALDLRRSKADADLKKQILNLLADDGEFRDQVLATLGLALVNDELRQLEDRVATIENKQQE